jgi:uncharacterized membrane protein YgaE (UPF0421/DUF939 family)
MRAKNKISVLMALEMSCTCSLSYLAGAAISSRYPVDLGSIGTLWCMISAIVVMQATWSESLQQAALRIGGTLLGTVFGIVCFLSLGFTGLAFGVGIMLLVLVCRSAGLEQSLRLALLTMSVIFVGGLGENNPQPIYISSLRMLESLVGIVITLALRYITKPLHHRLSSMQRLEDTKKTSHKSKRR